MERDKAAQAFLAKVHSLVSDYLGGTAPAGPLRFAVRRLWSHEHLGRAASRLDAGAIRHIALQEYTDIDLSWPTEKPPSVQTLQGALKEVVALCDDPRSGANGARH